IQHCHIRYFGHNFYSLPGHRTRQNYAQFSVHGERRLSVLMSEPPRGSGWVRSPSERVYDVPTRYREVVLTVSKLLSGFIRGRLFERRIWNIDVKLHIGNAHNYVAIRDVVRNHLERNHHAANTSIVAETFGLW